MVRELYPAAPVLLVDDEAQFLVSAAADTETAVRCMRQGALAYLPKPLCGDSLIAVVKQAAFWKNGIMQ